MKIATAVKLGVNIDHVATLRQARRAVDPDLAAAALVCRQAGADMIVCHLRQDRRHIQDADVRRLRRAIATRLNLETSADEDRDLRGRQVRVAWREDQTFAVGRVHTPEQEDS